VLRRGVERGIFSALRDEELGVLLLLAPLMFCFGKRIDRGWLATGTAEAFWKARRARPG